MGTVQALISLFKEQLENECKTLIDQSVPTNRGQALIWWYFLSFYGMNDTEIEEIYCDGGGDLGIDAIHIDGNKVVHFFTFKNPEDACSGFPGGAIDSMIVGLNLIMQKQHLSVANGFLRERIEEIYKIVPRSYCLHIVSSGGGISTESAKKLGSFIQSLKIPTADFFTYKVEDIQCLQDKYYTGNLPTIEETVSFVIDKQSPYMVRAANHDSFSFHLPGRELAELYTKFGERMLQQNIRTLDVKSPANNAILNCCTSDDSKNFYHYNNGVTFLSNKAAWDNFASTLLIDGMQVVNGGQ